MATPEQMLEQAKPLGDAASITAMLATLIGWAPNAAAVLSLIWMAIRIYETKTVQGIIARRRPKR